MCCKVALMECKRFMPAGNLFQECMCNLPLKKVRIFYELFLVLFLFEFFALCIESPIYVRA